MASSRLLHRNRFAPAMFIVGCLLLLPGVARAVEGAASTSASARVTLRIVVAPVFRILQVRAVPGGYEVRVWTNLRSAHLAGREYRFAHVGETLVIVPHAAWADQPYIHPGV